MKELVSAFLSWKLPEDFAPDAYIQFDKEKAAEHGWPIGTNLLNAEQAEAMFRYCINKWVQETMKGVITVKDSQFTVEKSIELQEGTKLYTEVQFVAQLLQTALLS